MTLLCLAGYAKGHAFLREAKRQGCSVILLSSLSLQETAHWPLESIDEVYYMPDINHEWNRADTIKSVSYLARTREIDRIVALDDFDAEMAAALREHLRLPGIGETQVRLFRDKLAMRLGAAAAAIRVPEFSPVFHHAHLSEFLARVPGPWVLKPRSLAGAIGIKKIHSAEELWPQLELLGDMQSYYLLERFVPGRVFHVDTLVYQSEFVFAIASGYGRPPMEVSHGGGVFTTEVLDRQSVESTQLLNMNRSLLSAFGLKNGVSHSEFIQAYADGQIYFLETSARVGGAHIADLIEAASGLNLWTEWAKIECAQGGGAYTSPQPREDYAGLLVSLARQEHPDTSSYKDPEIVWRMDHNSYHVGLIVQSPDRHRVQYLVAEYTQRLQRDFGATLPPRDKLTA
ncbi:MAG TPA: ATPase [Bryobacteraceae bacterium]|nr:ATPase [Bryobacteraceae bacterium]